MDKNNDPLQVLAKTQRPILKFQVGNERGIELENGDKNPVLCVIP
jgi:hypothetical protein